MAFSGCYVLLVLVAVNLLCTVEAVDILNAIGGVVKSLTERFTGDARSGSFLVQRMAIAIQRGGVSEVSASKTKLLEMCLEDYRKMFQGSYITNLLNSQTGFLERVQSVCEPFNKLMLECEASYPPKIPEDRAKIKEICKYFEVSSGSAQVSSWILSTLALLCAMMLK